MYKYGDPVHSLEDDQYWIDRNRETRGAVVNELLDMNRAAQVEARALRSELKRVSADKYADRISEGDAEVQYASLNDQIDDIGEFMRLTDRMRGVVKLAAAHRTGKSKGYAVWRHQLKVLQSDHAPTKYDLELWAAFGMDVDVAIRKLNSQGKDLYI